MAKAVHLMMTHEFRKRMVGVSDQGRSSVSGHKVEDSMTRLQKLSIPQKLLTISTGAPTCATLLFENINMEGGAC